MKITIHDVIKSLPLDEAFRDDLLNRYDKLDPDTKYDVGDLLWGAYYALFEMKMNENMDLALARAKENQENLDSGFYQRVREQTMKEMQQGFYQKTADADLEAIRTKLQTLMNKN